VRFYKIYDKQEMEDLGPDPRIDQARIVIVSGAPGCRKQLHLLHHTSRHCSSSLEPSDDITIIHHLCLIQTRNLNHVSPQIGSLLAPGSPQSLDSSCSSQIPSQTSSMRITSRYSLLLQRLARLQGYSARHRRAQTQGERASARGQRSYTHRDR
jgi:hypothetical protein